MKRKLLYIIVLISSWTISGQISLVEDIFPGSEQSNPREFLEHDGLLFFIGSTSNVNAIYAMDLTENVNLIWSEIGNFPSSMIIYNNELYFNANNQLHKLNVPYGTGSTIVNPNIAVWGAGYVFNGELYFGGEMNQTDPLNPNYELMAFNGTTARLIEDESSISLEPQQFVEHLGELYFIGEEMATIGGQPTTVNALYKTNGIDVNIVTFFENTSVSYLTSLGNDLYFLYRLGDFTQPYNLWYSNSTATGGFGDELSFAFGLTIFDNKLYFYDAVNRILYSTSQLGNFVPVPIETGTEYPSVGFPITSDSLMSFEGSTNTFGSELYIYEKDTEIKFTEDYNPGNASFTPVYGAFFNNKLYLSGDDGSGIGRELHVYDPSVCANTVDIEDSNFETYLENVLGVGDGILGNKKVCQEKIEVLTTLNISGLGISDLTGLEFFSALEILNVSDNDLNSIELQNLSLREIYATNCNLAGKTIRFQNNPPNGSFLTNVTTLELQYNNLGNSGSSIGFGGLPNLIYLDVQNNSFGTIRMGETPLLETVIANNCPNLSTLENLNTLQNLASLGASGSNFTSIDLSQNDALSFINLSSNNLTSIVFPTNSTISDLYLDDNLFTTLDISGIDQNLGYFSVTGNGSLNCILVDDVSFAESQTDWYKDVGAQYATNCSAQPFTVTPALSGAGTGPDYTITEGNSFSIDFDADNTATNGEQYTPIIAFSLNGAPATDDFLFNGSEIIPNAPFTVSANNPDGSITVEAKDDGEVEIDEVYTISVASSDTSLYSMSEPSSFTITVKDIPEVVSEPFLIETTLSDNVILDAFGNFTVDEGETFTIKLNASSPASEFYNYLVTYTIEGTTASSNDYFLASNPKAIIVQESMNPDGELVFTINTDDLPDDDEKLTINLLPDPNLIFTWAGDTVNPDGSLTYEIIINDIPPIISDIITVRFDNTGGIEGGTETFTATLFDSQGNPWSDHNGLEFSLTFENEIFDTDIQYAIDNQKIIGEKASPGDYLPQDGSGVNGLENAKIVLPSGSSSGSYTVTYKDDTDQVRDYYYVEISSTNSNFSFDNEILQAVILDKDGQFLIDIYPGVNMSVIPPDGTGDFDPNCCLEFSVEEGETFEIYLDVEKGVPANERYKAYFSFPSGTAEEGADKDFTHTNAGKTINGTVTDGLGPFDNRLIINVNEDDVPNERGDEKIGEKFQVKFDSVSSPYTIVNQEEFIDGSNPENDGNIEKLSRRQTFDMRIIDVIKIQEFRASQTKNIARENPLENAEFEIELETANASGENIRINYEILVNGTNNATPGQDYLIDNFDLNTLTGFVNILYGNNSGKIIIKPIDDLKFENIENVVVKLTEGNRYSISNLTSKQITIESDDDADYTATIKKGADNQSRESDPNDFAEVIIELNEIPMVDIEVEIKISDQTDLVRIIEGQDYLIYQDDKETVITSENRKVTITANTAKSKSVFIKALNDTEAENNESLYLQLDSGVNYEPISPEDAEVVLISSTSDTSSFDPRTITVIAKNPRCPEK